MAPRRKRGDAGSIPDVSTCGSGPPFSPPRPYSDRLKTVIAETDSGAAWVAIWDQAPKARVISKTGQARFNPSAARTEPSRRVARLRPACGRVEPSQGRIVQGGLGPVRPHKPETRSVRFRPLQLELRPRAASVPSPRAGEGLARRAADELRAGRPRVARLQVGGRLVGDRRALPLKRRWRRSRPVSGRGPFESVGGLFLDCRRRHHGVASGPARFSISPRSWISALGGSERRWAYQKARAARTSSGS